MQVLIDVLRLESWTPFAFAQLLHLAWRIMFLVLSGIDSLSHRQFEGLQSTHPTLVPKSSAKVRQ